MELASATVLITGAAKGIGRALAEGFLRDGADVLAVDVDAVGLSSLAELGAHTETGDVGDPADVQRFVAKAVAISGRLDVLINNAGIGVQRTIEEMDTDEYERTLRVNLFGPFYGLKFALPAMRSQGFGRVINVISRNAEFNPAGLSGYSGSKAALWSLTQTAAKEVSGVDILVNALIPGPTLTDMNPRGVQGPEVVYPTAKMLATLPAEGPTGRCFWNLEEYQMYRQSSPPVAS